MFLTGKDCASSCKMKSADKQIKQSFHTIKLSEYFLGFNNVNMVF